MGYKKIQISEVYDEIKALLVGRILVYHWNGIIGPGSHRSAEFREGRLALVLAIAAFIIITIGVGILILK